jgi:long-chain acyl-CoA synthetase
VAGWPGDPVPDQSLGTAMLYSSGTTGQPKGILRPRPTTAPTEPLPPMLGLSAMFGFRAGMSYLNPAPLHHSAPSDAVAGALRLGPRRSSWSASTPSSGWTWCSAIS